MANTKTGALAAAPKTAAQVKEVSTLSLLIKDTDVQKRFHKMLGKKSAGFLSSLLTLVNNNDLLKKANPATVLSAAATAASLDLPVNPSLGMAYVVPYGDKAQFQIGYKGLIALAQRTGLMKSIVMTPVFEGEITNWNRFTETYSQGERLSNKVVGYFARFETVNGFAKGEYWTKEAVTEHAIKFNPMCKAAGKLKGAWVTNFDAMACKTVLKHILSIYAPLSIEMQRALESDNSEIGYDENGEPVPVKETVEVEAEEVKQEVPFSDEPAPVSQQEQQEILAMMGD